MEELINKMNDMSKSISDFTNGTKSFFQTIGDICYYTTHPKMLAFLAWNGAVKYSFTVCLTVTLVGLILYIIGIKKGAKYSKIAFFSYLTIQIFNAASR